MKQTVENKPVSGGFYMNPLVGALSFSSWGGFVLL